jgi:hypothetical protein
VISRKAIRLDPKAVAAYSGLGSVYVSTNRKTDALKMYSTLKPLDAAEAQKLMEQINKMR